MVEQVWFDAKSIAEQGLILDFSGKKNPRFVTRMIREGKLKARKDGGKYLVHIDWIRDFNSPDGFSTSNTSQNS